MKRILQQMVKKESLLSEKEGELGEKMPFLTMGGGREKEKGVAK